MEKNRKYQLFSASGCLTEEGLIGFTRGLLSEDEKALVNLHIQSCELCAFAADGCAQADPAMFSEDVELMGLRFEKTPTAENDIPQAQAVTRPVIPFRKRYRIGLAAAFLFLLIAVGGWQIYLNLKQSRDSGNLATVEVKTETNDEIAFSPVSKPDSIRQTDVKVENTPPPSSELQKNENTPVAVDRHLVVEDDSEKSLQKSPEHAQTTVSKKEIVTEADTLKIGKPSVNEMVFEAAAQKDATEIDKSSWAKGGEEESETEIFTVVEESPQFPGGHEARQKFLEENIRFPKNAGDSLIQGTVFVSFVVEKDGSITDIRVLRGIGGGCDEEAVRIIKLMPRWTPGKQRGKPVRVHFNMPVKFLMAG